MLERVCPAVTDNGSKFHKYFEPEYKKEIVRLVEELGRSPSEVARDIGCKRNYHKALGSSIRDQGRSCISGERQALSRR